MEPQKEAIRFAWVRCQVGEPVHDLAKYVKDRLGLANIPMAYTYLLHYAYWDRMPEDVCQEMAASMQITLPPLSEEIIQLPLTEEQNGTLPE